MAHSPLEFVDNFVDGPLGKAVERPRSSRLSRPSKFGGAAVSVRHPDPAAKAGYPPTDCHDAELGPVRRCRCCGEWWPLSGEFFEANNRVAGGRLRTCQACRNERRTDRQRQRRLEIKRASYRRWQIGR